MDSNDIIVAHQFSSDNREELQKDKKLIEEKEIIAIKILTSQAVLLRIRVLLK